MDMNINSLTHYLVVRERFRSDILLRNSSSSDVIIVGLVDRFSLFFEAFFPSYFGEAVAIATASKMYPQLRLCDGIMQDMYFLRVMDAQENCFLMMVMWL